ncbi:MAG TPA: hypothetical protein VGB18_03500 [Candidatus Thermoplasmatota archaeon]
MRRALVWTLALLLAPTTAAQSMPPGHVIYCSHDCLPYDVNDEDTSNVPVNVVLYAHILDALQRAPLNVIPPDLGKEPDINRGFPTPTLKVAEDVLWFNNNGFVMYHMPTFMRYEGQGLNQDGPLAYQMNLSKEGAKLFWYMSPHAVPQSNSTASPVGSIGAMPMVTVSATIETGRHPGYGELIAHGSTSTPAMIGAPTTDYAYEFEVPLTVVLDKVPPEEGFVVHVTWQQLGTEESQIAQSDWRIRTGPRFAPRVILPVENPMRLSEVTTIYRSGTHYLVTDITSLFGAYDLNPFSLNMTFRDGPMAAGKPQPIYYFPNSRVPHTVRIVWALPPESPDVPGLKAGTYDFKLAASNLWGTYAMNATVPLDILQFSSAKSKTPGPELPLLLVGIAMLAIVLRRRHN